MADPPGITVEALQSVHHGAVVTSSLQHRILHVLPTDLSRGAQAYARALVDALDPLRSKHQILTIFEAPPAGLEPDITLGVGNGFLRRSGLDPIAIWKLRRQLHSSRPAVVVAHGGESAKYATFAAANLVPYIYVRIGTTSTGTPKPFSRALHNYYTKRAKRIVAVSEDVAAETRARANVDPGKILVIPNGRDVEVYRPRTSSRPDGPVRLIFVGYLDEGKRPEVFIDAVRVLRDRGRDVVGWMVGEGHRFDALRSRADEAGIEMMGRRTDVPDLLREADVLVFTSRPPEGMPGVIIEAGLTGLPVVSTRVPGVAEVVEHGETGLLVGVDDFDSLVDALALLVDDPAERQRMGEAALRRCSSRFSLEVTTREWRQVLDELIGEA